MKSALAMIATLVAGAPALAQEVSTCGWRASAGLRVTVNQATGAVGAQMELGAE